MQYGDAFGDAHVDGHGIGFAFITAFESPLQGASSIMRNYRIKDRQKRLTGSEEQGMVVNYRISLYLSDLSVT